jgi:hypothetical protein
MYDPSPVIIYDITSIAEAKLGRLPKAITVPTCLFGSNLFQQTDHLKVFHGFPHSLHENTTEYLKLGHNSFLPHHFQIVFIPNATIQRHYSQRY